MINLVNNYDSRQVVSSNYKQKNWIRNLPTWLTDYLPILILEQKSVQTFDSEYSLNQEKCEEESSNGKRKSFFLSNVKEAQNSRGDGLDFLAHSLYTEKDSDPKYRTSYNVNGQEITNTKEHFRYSHWEKFTGHESSLLSTSGFKGGNYWMIAEEEPFEGNGIDGSGTAITYFRSKHANRPYNEALLEGDLFKKLPSDFTKQYVTTRSRVGIALDPKSAVKWAVAMTSVAVAAVAAVYFAG